jgi:hypothetical protein
MEGALAAQEAIEECLHWSGEDPYDEERARTIQEAANESCAQARSLTLKHLDELLKEPAGAFAVIQAAGHLGQTPPILPQDRLPAACALAKAERNRRLSQEPDAEFPYFDLMCSAPK